MKAKVKFDIDEKTYAKILETLAETNETFDEFVEKALWFRMGQLSGLGLI